MANLDELDEFPAVRRLETTDRVKGGPDGPSNIAPQQLTARTRHLYLRSTPLADLNALKAIAAPADGLVRTVKRVGVYVFETANVAAESLPWIVAPSVGGGRWVHLLYDAVGGANELVAYASDGKLPAASVPNRFVGMTHTTLAAAQSTTSNSFVDVPNLTVNVAVQAGDILQVDASLVVYYSGTDALTAGGTAQIVVVDGATTYRVATRGSLKFSQALSLMGRHVVQAAGTAVVKVRFTSLAAHTMFVGGGNPTNDEAASSLRTVQFRP